MGQSTFMKRMVKLMKAEKKKKDPFASGESFTTLHNKAARDEEHQQLLREQGFPSEQDPNAMRYQRYVEVESDPDSPDGVAHNTPPWIVNEASELLADIPDEDAPSYPKSEKAKNRAGELSKSEGIKYGNPITPERYKPIEKGLFDKLRGKKKEEEGQDEEGIRRSPEFAARRAAQHGGLESDWAEGRVGDLPPFLRPQEQEESTRLTERDFESLEAAKAAQARQRKLLADKKLTQAQQKATKAETNVDKLPPFLEQSLSKHYVGDADYTPKPPPVEKTKIKTDPEPITGDYASMQGRAGGSITLPEGASQASQDALANMTAQALRQREGRGEFKGNKPMTVSEQRELKSSAPNSTFQTYLSNVPDSKDYMEKSSLVKRLGKLQKQAGPTRRPPPLYGEGPLRPGQERTSDSAGLVGKPPAPPRMEREGATRRFKLPPSRAASKPKKQPLFDRHENSVYSVDLPFTDRRAAFDAKKLGDNFFSLDPERDLARGAVRGAKNLYGRLPWNKMRKSKDLDTLTKRLVKLQKQSPSEGGPQRWQYKPTTVSQYYPGTEDEFESSQGRPRSTYSGEYASVGERPGGTMRIPKNASDASRQELWNMSAQAERQRAGKGEYADVGPMDYKTQMGKEHPWGAIGTKTKAGTVDMNPNTGTYSYKQPSGRKQVGPIRPFSDKEGPTPTKAKVPAAYLGEYNESI